MFAPPKGLNSWHWGHLFQNFDRGPRLDHQNIGPALQPEPMTNKFHNLGRGLLEHYNHAFSFFFGVVRSYILQLRFLLHEF